MIISWSGGSQEVVADDSSYRLRQIMGENSISLNFSLPDYVEIPLGATIEFQAQTYILNTPQEITEKNSTNFEYKLLFGSYQEKLANFKIKDIDNRLKFPYTAKPSEHIQLILDVLNTYDSGWTLGNCIDNNEKLISYNHTNCLDALQMIADEFQTEWEIKTKVIHLQKLSYNEISPLALSYGMGNGFVSGVGRKNDGGKTGFNVLYVQGGDRNIDLSVYGTKDLLLPKSQVYNYEGKNYITDANGLYIVRQGVTITNRKEQSLDATHIYPQRIGTISGVEVVDAVNNFYDFFDASIPEDLDFSTLRMDGEKMTVYFESGALAGREFDIEQSDSVISGYIHSKRRFKLVPKEEDGYTMPNATFIPAIGDKYAIFGMMMPTAYISHNPTQTGASWEMYKEAVKHFYENEESAFTFKGELDGIWAKNDWLNIGGKIVIGGYVSFSDPKFQPTGINIRITQVKDFLNKPYSPVIELANSVQSRGVSSELDKISQNEVVVEMLHDKSLEYTRRYFRDSKESIRLLNEALLNFDGGIQPVTIETMQILIGDESLQYRFVDAPQGNEVQHVFTYDVQTKQFSTPAGIVQHLTLGQDAIAPNQDLLEWNVSAYTSAVLDVPEKTYYLYIKASKLDNSAVFILSETAIALEGVTDYYHFLTGLLNSEYQESRSFVTMYGFTEILPGQIKVDKLTSGDGSQWIRLLQNQIQINASVSFTNDSPAFEQVKASTLATLQIGAHNLILDSDEIKEFYSLSIEKRDRYFEQLRWYTISIDAFNNSNFTGKIKVIGHNIPTGTTLLGEKDITLVANQKTRLHITFECMLMDYSQFEIIIVDGLDAEAIGVVLYQPKLELGQVPTDWNVAEEDTIASIQSFQDDLKYILYNYQDNVDEYFRDGIITEAEANSIANYKNVLNTEKTKLDVEYSKLYLNVLLTGTAKTDLFDTKTLYDTAHSNLILAIDTAIADGKATQAEADDVDAKFVLYRTALLNYSTAYGIGLEFVSNVNIQAMQAYVDDALLNFDGNVSEGFRDGIITESEANSIGNYLNTLLAEKLSWTARYNILYANPTLGGATKTTLYGTHQIFGDKYDLLVTAINNAIADNSTTPQEKALVDTAFNDYRNSMIAFVNAFEVAQRFITDTDIAGTTQDVSSVLARVQWLNETLIEGFIVGTGVLAVGNENGANAFISGLDTGVNALRFIAGSTWANRANAPFRVYDDGRLFTVSGTIGGWIIQEGSIESVDGGELPTIVLDSVNGSIRVNDSSGKVSTITKDGILVNTGNMQCISATTGITGKASLVGLGFGNVAKDTFDNNFLCGVYGSVANASTNPAKSFGGYFNKFFATGIHFQVKSIQSTYTCTADDYAIHCYNTASITVYLPLNAMIGRVIDITRINDHDVVVNGNGKMLLRRGTRTTTNAFGYGDAIKFTWNGGHWVYFKRD